MLSESPGRCVEPLKPMERLKTAVCRKCEGHDDAVRVLAVAGGKVFSGSYDGSIGVW